jgi:hypothetical protein
MPFYTYQCPTCQAVEEQLRPMTLRDKNPPHHMHTVPGYRGIQRVPFIRTIAPVVGIVRNPAVPRRRA